MYGKIYKFPCHATRQNNKYINIYETKKNNKEYLYGE